MFGKECSYQMSVTYSDGAKTDRSAKSKDTGSGSVEYLIRMLKNLQKEPAVKNLKTIEIRVSVK